MRAVPRNASLVSHRRILWAGDLELELDLPAAEPRGLAVLVPGLFATSHFFRVPADAGQSPAEWLRNARELAVVHFDPRGLGRNHGRATRGIDLASRVRDLHSVLAAASRLLPELPMLALGHSFGGTLIYAALAQGAPMLRAAVTVGSPAKLTPRSAPWERVFTPSTEAMVKQVSEDGWCDQAAFAWLQNKIFSGTGHWPWLPLWAVRLGTRACARNRVLARASAAQPKVASMLYRASREPAARDYTAAELQRLVAAGALERESSTLLLQLLAWAQSGGNIAMPGAPSLAAAAARVDTPVLVTSSSADAMVLPVETAAFASPRSKHVDVGDCGHGGYFFRADVRERWFEQTRQFLDANGF